MNSLVQPGKQQPKRTTGVKMNLTTPSNNNAPLSYADNMKSLPGQKLIPLIKPNWSSCLS
jgi:hypothetical protein